MYDADKEAKRIQKEIRPIFKQLEKELTELQDKAMSGVKDEAEEILKEFAAADSRDDKRKLKDRYIRLIRTLIGTKQYKKLEAMMLDALYKANNTAIEAMEKHKYKVYQQNYNEAGNGLKKALNGYDFKPISEEDAHFAKLTKLTVNKTKLDKWNRNGIRTGMQSGTIMMMGAGAIAAMVVSRMISRNQRIANENAEGMVYDSSSLGVYDGIARTNDEGYDTLKKWIAVLDSRTRDSHRDLDGEEIPLDEEFKPNLMRPRDPDAPPAETKYCRCKLGYSTGGRPNRTRAARQGEVTGSYLLDSSFRGTRTVTVPNMNYREWQKWRSKS